MKKSVLWLIGLLVAIPFISSCEETDGEIDLYTDWEERNQAYIDSIATVARANPAEWKVIHTYTFPESSTSIGVIDYDVNAYVYCRVLEEGNGNKPFYTDSVSVNYRGQLIPLYDGSKVVFDQSYQGELDKNVAVPVSFAVSGVIEGWTTALQEMQEGARWEVYIPSDLGYGDYSSGSIPGHSTLCFDVHLSKVKTNR